MGWFKKIPKMFMTIFGFVAVISLVLFIIDLSSTDNSEKPEKITGFVVNHIIPTQVSWIAKAINTITNPWVLLFVICTILWLFGYFTKRRR